MRYFVSYSHRRGFGHAEVPYKGLIEGIEDVRTIEKEIEKTANVKNVVILVYIPLHTITIAEIKTGDLISNNGGLVTTNTFTTTTPSDTKITGVTGTSKEPSTKIIK